MENPAIRSYVDELRAPSPALAPIIDLRGRVSWHGSDRLDGTVRARESEQVLDIGPLGPGMRADRVLTLEPPSSGGSVCETGRGFPLRSSILRYLNNFGHNFKPELRAEALEIVKPYVLGPLGFIHQRPLKPQE